MLKAMQQHIVTYYVSRYFSVKRVKATFDVNDATWKFIHSILGNARQSGKGGPVAEYLVGAKLSLRFPEKQIRNKQFSVPTYRPDTAATSRLEIPFFMSQLHQCPSYSRSARTTSNVA